MYSLAREAHGERGKMPLEPGVDGEAAGRGVHAGDVLHAVDVLRAELVPVVPVVVVQMLPYERVRLHGAVRVHLRHVHVVEKVDELREVYKVKVNVLM